MTQTSTTPRASVIGLGNVLLGDDGFGPSAIEVFRSEYECGPEVEVVDLGTPGLDLAPHLYGRDLVVIVDAVDADGEPGTVRSYSESEFMQSEAQLRLTDHDQELQESLARLRLVDRAPAELIVIGVIPESCDFGEKISSTVLAASSVAVDNLVWFLRQHGFECRRRADAIRPKLWWTVDHGRPELCKRR